MPPPSGSRARAWRSSNLLPTGGLPTLLATRDMRSALSRANPLQAQPRLREVSESPKKELGSPGEDLNRPGRRRNSRPRSEGCLAGSGFSPAALLLPHNLRAHPIPHLRSAERGSSHFVSHEGERPMRICWKLEVAQCGETVRGALGVRGGGGSMPVPQPFDREGDRFGRLRPGLSSAVIPGLGWRRTQPPELQSRCRSRIHLARSRARTRPS